MEDEARIIHPIQVVLALPQSGELPPFRQRETVLICGNQPDMLREAVAFGVACVVLCQAELPEEIRAQVKNTCIISTPYDGFRAVRRRSEEHTSELQSLALMG